jgi:CHAT domain-containing protein
MLPFGLLTPAPEKYLCDEYAVLVSPSQETMNTLRSYQPYQSELSSAKALVVGNPDIKAEIEVHGHSFSQLSSLPGAEKEASVIQKLFDREHVTYLTQAEANEEAIRQAIKDSNIIHLATHGLAFEDHPMNSLIVVAGGEGYVTARTIRAWEMPADLVVLSACQTALGRLAETEGVIGLSRSFFIAGARTVVVSLWSVDDNATAKLMEYFYQLLFTGKSVPAAMRAAQLKLKSQPQYAHPFYWAGFVVVGADC